MIPAKEARRRLDTMIEAARDHDDGKCRKTFGGKSLLVVVIADELSPALLWGEGEVPIEKHLAVQPIQMFGNGC
jgi:hypothetical protein